MSVIAALFVDRRGPYWGRDDVDAWDIERNAWTCCVEQGHYGHRSRKATWLYLVTAGLPPSLIWGASEGIRLDEGFHSRAERQAARAAGIKPVERLPKSERHITPPAFAELLLSLARSAMTTPQLKAGR